MSVFINGNSFCRFLSPVFSLMLLSVFVKAQTDYVIIDSIIVDGNEKTKSNVILREIDINQGDTIYLNHLSGSLIINEKRLESTGLFTLAKLNIKNWNTETGRCFILVSVKEFWYIYPYVILELADRNFNVWKDEHNYSLDRINYGLAIRHNNLSGNKDKLKLKFQHGYTRKYEVRYEYPYLKNKWGAAFQYLYSNNREIIYKTLNNKPLFVRHPDERTIFSKHILSTGLTHRTNAKTNQFFLINFQSAKVDHFVSKEQNPEYFGSGKSDIRFISLDYLIRYDNSIYPLYPLGGYSVVFNIRKEGIGILGETNNLWSSMTLENHLPIFKKAVLSTKLKVKYNFLNAPMPYFLNNAIGYEQDVITGYQLYVMDGRDFGIFSNALKYNILDKDVNMDYQYLPKQFKTLNLKLFFRFNLDYGYARDPVFATGNFLANRVNYGYGPALDLIIYNYATLSFQYGITSFGEKGLFFQSDVNF